MKHIITNVTQADPEPGSKFYSTLQKRVMAGEKMAEMTRWDETGLRELKQPLFTTVICWKAFQNAQHIKAWSRWATTAQDDIKFHMLSAKKTGLSSYNGCRFLKTRQQHKQAMSCSRGYDNADKKHWQSRVMSFLLTVQYAVSFSLDRNFWKITRHDPFHAAETGHVKVGAPLAPTAVLP